MPVFILIIGIVVICILVFAYPYIRDSKFINKYTNDLTHSKEEKNTSDVIKNIEESTDTLKNKSKENQKIIKDVEKDNDKINKFINGKENNK